MSQNTSSAVMQQRHEDARALDDYPTPPWATRALMEYVIFKLGDEQARLKVSRHVALDPACGRGHIVRTLNEYFGAAEGSDVHDYGWGVASEITNFLDPAYQPRPHWIITNPPFRLGEAFTRKALELSEIGCAMLVRTSFLEGVGRYRDIFSQRPPTVVAQFTERVPMHRSKLTKKGSTATSYAWLVWVHGAPRLPLEWIPPCRKKLEMDADYFWTGEE